MYKQQRLPSGVAVSHELLCRLYSPVAYQRERLGSRRGSRGLASLTVRVRPPISWPWSLAMAVLAAVPSGISTKPKPLERPVSRSVMTRISSTVPYGSKSWRRSWSVVLNARLPTKIFMGSSLWERGHTIARSSEQYAGAPCKSHTQEKGRESLGITRHVLWFRRTATREYHKIVMMEREEHVSAQVSENVALKMPYFRRLPFFA